MDSRFSPAAFAAFELFFLPWMRRRVHAVRIAGLPADPAPGQPLLLVANHVSWWDGFALREVQRLLRPRAPLYTVMLRDELERFPFFRRMGAVGVDPAVPASVAHALRALRDLGRAQPAMMVSFFPQGRIWPSFRRPLGFRRGVELMARRLAPLHLLPVGLHLEPLNRPSPTLFVSAGAPVALPDGAVAADALERAVETQLDGIHALLAREGEHAGDAWPSSPFLPLSGAAPSDRGSPGAPVPEAAP